MNNHLSPPPIVEADIKGLTFDEAIKQLIMGKMIARHEWNNKDYGILADGWLSIHKNDTFFVWKVSDGDLLATDWFVL